MAGRNKIRVAVLSGGQSPEHDVSLASGRNVLGHIDQHRYRSFSVVIDRRGAWHIDGGAAQPATEALKKLHGRIDVVFLALHGTFGEDGTIQAILESLNIPYTGSGVAASALAMDKHLTNSIAQSIGFPVPKWRIVQSARSLEGTRLPAVLKPIRGGSSVGTEIIRIHSQKKSSLRRAKRYGTLMLQKFIPGREVTCGVLERRGKPFALPPTEIRPQSSTWFNYYAKYTVGGSDEITPAPLTRKQTIFLQTLAVRAHTMLNCRGMSRSDFIFAKGRFWFLETNTIPGLTKTSLLPQQAISAGISFSKLIDLVITASLKRGA